jgi:hypothetical protein
LSDSGDGKTVMSTETGSVYNMSENEITLLISLHSGKQQHTVHNDSALQKAYSCLLCPVRVTSPFSTAHLRIFEVSCTCVLHPHLCIMVCLSGALNGLDYIHVFYIIFLYIYNL